MKHYLSILLACAILFISNLALADVHQYQIEMIVFSHINANRLDSEQWPVLTTSPLQNFKDAYQLLPDLDTPANPNATPDPFKPMLLQSSYYFLNPVLNKLNQSPAYQVILHTAWTQAVHDTKHERWIHIYGGHGFDNNGNVVAQDLDGTVPYDLAAHWQVDGLMKLNLIHYFNTRYIMYFVAPTADIQNISQNTNFQNIDNPLLYFKLDQTRRMRSNELNYIGHPMYGVLIKIKRVS